MILTWECNICDTPPLLAVTCLRFQYARLSCPNNISNALSIFSLDSAALHVSHLAGHTPIFDMWSRNSGHYVFVMTVVRQRFKCNYLLNHLSFVFILKQWICNRHWQRLSNSYSYIRFDNTKSTNFETVFRIQFSTECRQYMKYTIIQQLL